MPENRTEPFSSTGAMGVVKEKAQETTSLVKERAQEMASSVASKAEEVWDSTKQGVQQAASTVATTAEEAFDSVTHFMRKYPFATLGIGVCAGFLLGRFLNNSLSARTRGGQQS
jgi:ElaB/YqjD/DUF883 family membrane-anchored ribosome-binding protein